MKFILWIQHPVNAYPIRSLSAGAPIPEICESIILAEKSKINVLDEVKRQGHVVGPVIYCFILFHSMSIELPIPEIWPSQNFGFENPCQGHGGVKGQDRTYTQPNVSVLVLEHLLLDANGVEPLKLLSITRHTYITWHPENASTCTWCTKPWSKKTQQNPNSTCDTFWMWLIRCMNIR